MRDYTIEYPMDGVWTDHGTRSFGASGEMTWETLDNGAVHVTFTDGPTYR